MFDIACSNQLVMFPSLRGSNPYPCGSLTYRTIWSIFCVYQNYSMPNFSACQPALSHIQKFYQDKRNLNEPARIFVGNETKIKTKRFRCFFKETSLFLWIGKVPSKPKKFSQNLRKGACVKPQKGDRNFQMLCTNFYFAYRKSSKLAFLAQKLL